MINAARKKLSLPGTHRTRSFEDTLSWLWPPARAAGVTRLANVTGLDVIGIPVWTAIRPNSRGLATSQGKGPIDAAAKVSALMESVESWHAETMELPVAIADYATLLSREEAADPATLNVRGTQPPRPDLPIAWVQGDDILNGVSCRVPFECVSTNYVVDHRNVLNSTFVQSSNGLAGGNERVEAIVHGLAEVVERSAIARYEQQIRSFDASIRVRLDSIDDELCAGLIAQLDRAGIATAVFALEAAGIPVYACTILEREIGARWRALPPFNGYGCHLDPAIALSRAITEAVQSRATYISGSRDDIMASEYARSGNPDDLAAYQALFASSDGSVRFDGASAGTDTFDDDLALLTERLKQAGCERVIVVDLSKPTLGIPVVKVVVPGLAIPNALVHERDSSAPVGSRRGA